MPSGFLQGLTRGIATAGEGYLKGQRATQDKAREEEFEREKSATDTYYKLLESGHWEKVPESGARTGEVIQINGQLLQPRPIPPWERAKYDEAELERKEAARRRQFAGETDIRSAGEAERKEAHELKMRSAAESIKQIELDIAKAKGKFSGVTVDIQDPRTGNILRVPIELYQDKSKLHGLDEFILGKPSKTTPGPADKRADEEAVARRVEQATKAEVSLNKPDIVGNRSRARPLIDFYNNTAEGPEMYVFKDRWGPSNKAEKIRLPMAFDTVAGRAFQMTLSDVRQIMAEEKKSFTQVIQELRKLYPQWAYPATIED